MIAFKTPLSSLKRLLENDFSEKFIIIFTIKRTNDKNDDIIIEEEKKIIINSTINKVRIISEIIEEEYIKDPTINHYNFDISNLEQMLNRKIKSNEIINIIGKMVGHHCEEKNLEKEGQEQEFLQAMISVLDGEKPKVICKFHNDKLDGIISYIRRNTGDSLDGTGKYLKLSGGAAMCSYYPLSHLIQYDENIDKVYINYINDGKVYTQKDAWIEFDFVQSKINITSYTIRSSEHAPNLNCHPKSWKIIGSNNQNTWDLIDIKQNREEMNGPHICQHFECERKSRMHYRYIRYVQLDDWMTNGIAKYSICLSCMEFFGSIL